MLLAVIWVFFIFSFPALDFLFRGQGRLLSLLHYPLSSSPRVVAHSFSLLYPLTHYFEGRETYFFSSLPSIFFSEGSGAHFLSSTTLLHTLPRAIDSLSNLLYPLTPIRRAGVHTFSILYPLTHYFEGRETLFLSPLPSNYPPRLARGPYSYFLSFPPK